MKFNKYLTEQGKSKEIKMDKALEIVRSKCKQISSIYKDLIYIPYYAGKICIYTRDNYDFSYIEPSKFTKVSNYYTLLMDNLKSWSKYPERSKSIVCSFNFCQMSDCKIVFPFDGAKFGVCPQSDILLTDLNFIKRNIQLYEIPILIKAIFFSFVDLIKLNNPEKNFKNFKEACNKIDKNIDLIYSSVLSNRGTVVETIYKEIKKGKKLFDIITKDFSPEKMNFELVDLKQLYKIHSNREVWTDVNSVLVEYDVFEEFMSKL
ncbi:MAG: hypothetical protein ACOC56_01810 [Atribacterota bacterium]